MHCQTPEASEAGAIFNTKQKSSVDALACACLVYALGRVGFFAAMMTGDGAQFFIPSGLLAVMILLRGYQVSYALCLVSIIFCYQQYGLYGELPVWQKLAGSLLLGCAVSLQAVLAAFLMQVGFATSNPPITSLGQVFRLTSALLVCTGIGATLVGVNFYLFGPLEPSLYLLGTRWLGDFVVLLILMSTWLAFREEFRRLNWTPLKVAEAFLLQAIVTLIIVVYLTQDADQLLGKYATIFLFILTPIHMWVALSFRLTGFMVCQLQIATVAIGSAQKGFGMLFTIPCPEALLLTYLYLGAITISALILISSLGRRDQIEAEVLYQTKRYHNIFETSVLPIYEEDWSEVKTYIDQLKNSGVTDVASYFQRYPGELLACMRLVKLLDANQASVELLKVGGKQEALSGLETFVAAESLPAFVQLLGALAAGHTRYRGEQQLINKAGERLHVIFDFNCIFGYEHNLSRVVYSLFDITDSKANILKREAAELEMRRAKEAAEAASSAKSLFLANMSHEIRTPVCVIMGFSQMLEEQDLTLEERARVSSTLIKNGKHLLQLIDDILDLSKIEAQQLKVEFLSIDFGRFLDEVVLSINSLAQGRGVAFAMRRSAALPPTITTDPTRLRQILINIIGNAIKFTPPGGLVQVSIELVAEPEHRATGDIRFLIRDNGCGIEPEYQKKLFRFFAQGDPSYARRFGGTGLGLVLARRLARALGGDVWLEASQAGMGSTFGVSITGLDPRLDQVIGSEHSDADSLGPIDSTALQGLQILVVEDQPDLQVLIARELTRAGACVDVAGNGLEALTMAASTSYAAMVLDIQLPLLDGYKTAVILRERGYHLPLIALTAHAMKEDHDRSLNAGFSAHLAKPIKTQVLVDTILRHRQQSRPSLPGIRSLQAEHRPSILPTNEPPPDDPPPPSPATSA